MVSQVSQGYHFDFPNVRREVARRTSQRWSPRKYPKRSSNLLAREEVPLELAVREGALGQTTFWHVRKYPSGQLTSEEVSQEVAPLARAGRL